MRLEGLEKVPLLDQLYVSHNGLTAIEGLSAVPALTTLDLAGNRIEELTGMEALSGLADLWLNDNRVSDWEQVKRLEHMSELGTLYLERNPLQRSADYRRKLKLALPSLTQIDATMCK